MKRPMFHFTVETSTGAYRNRGFTPGGLDDALRIALGIGQPEALRWNAKWHGAATVTVTDQNGAVIYTETLT